MLINLVKLSYLDSVSCRFDISKKKRQETVKVDFKKIVTFFDIFI